jgi:hypothetical protein
MAGGLMLGLLEEDNYMSIMAKFGIHWIVNEIPSQLVHKVNLWMDLMALLVLWNFNSLHQQCTTVIPIIVVSK